MRSAIIARAKSVEADHVNSRPSRRGYAGSNGGNQAWWQTNQDMPRTIIAHAISENQIEKNTFLDALLKEADWGLGRNPLNLIRMTTATTSLADKRSVISIYTSGRDGGSPGLHPGHMPYMNTAPWGSGMIGNDPTSVFNLFYPSISNWPQSSKLIETRYIWCHIEFTPRQTMRGKTLLYGYLYGLGKVSTPTSDLGDVNRDGAIDIVDALLIAQYYVGLNPANFNAAKGDVNRDGDIDVVDALLIAQYYVGLITDFC